MTKTEISPKILKRKKKFFLTKSHQKQINTRPEKGSSFEPSMNQIHEAVQVQVQAVVYSYNTKFKTWNTSMKQFKL